MILVKFPVSLCRPVEKVCHNDVNLQSTAMIFRAPQTQLLLRPDSAAYTCRSQVVLRHHPAPFRSRICIGLLDLCRGISRCDPVVHLLRGFGITRFTLPKVTLPIAGLFHKNLCRCWKYKRDTCELRLLPAQCTALDIQIRLLMLTHSSRASHLIDSKRTVRR